MVVVVVIVVVVVVDAAAVVFSLGLRLRASKNITYEATHFPCH